MLSFLIKSVALRTGFLHYDLMYDKTGRSETPTRAMRRMIDFFRIIPLKPGVSNSNYLTLARGV